MRRTYTRGVVLVVVCVFAVAVSARPRDERPIRDPREKVTPIVKIVKKILKSFGDGLVIPTP